MSVRAYACHAPGSDQVLGYVAAGRVAEWPAETRIVQLRFGTEWKCALLDRTRLVEVEGLLVRDGVPADELECPECAPPPTPARDAAPEPPGRSAPAPVQAAAVALQGRRMVVVLVRRDVIDNPGEAALLQGAMQTRFGGVPVVLMGQDDDGTPRYAGDAGLLALLDGVPIEKMPWRTY